MVQQIDRGGDGNNVDILFTLKLSGLVGVIAACVIAPAYVRQAITLSWQKGWNIITPAAMHYQIASEDESGASTDVSAGSLKDMALDAVLAAVSDQESSGDHTAENESGSGATGKYQIMPDSYKDWANSGNKAAAKYSWEEFKSDPDIQDEVAREQMTLYYDEAVAANLSPCEIVRYIAAAWYSGDGNLKDDDKPQSWNGDAYPSIKSYADQVSAKTTCNEWSQAPINPDQPGQAAETLDNLSNRIELNSSTSQEAGEAQVEHVQYQDMIASLVTESIALPDFLAGIDTSTVGKGDTLAGDWRVTSGYELDRQVPGQPQVKGAHYAVDVVPANASDAEGSPLYAAFDGTVTIDDQGANGEFCHLTNANITVIYGHSRNCKEGSIKAGEQIAEIGTNSYGGPHLHLEMEVSTGADMPLAINPFKGVIERAINP